jgi:hypothetical protein
LNLTREHSPQFAAMLALCDAMCGKDIRIRGSRPHSNN